MQIETLKFKDFQSSQFQIIETFKNQKFLILSFLN